MSKGGGSPRARRRTYWLIVGSGPDRSGVFTIEDAEGEETLPVFSFEDEALLYLRLEALGKGWRARETTAGELVCVLLRAGPGCVALDPLPGVLGRETACLVSLGREDFLRTLVGERKAQATPRFRAPLALTVGPGFAPDDVSGRDG